jgi:hypothetical protein
VEFSINMMYISGGIPGTKDVGFSVKMIQCIGILSLWCPGRCFSTGVDFTVGRVGHEVSIIIIVSNDQYRTRI